MNKKYTLYFLIYYILFCFSTISAGILIGWSINEKLFNITPPSRGHDNAILVMSHNLKNFAMYLLLPIISPILQLTDLFSSTFQITLSVRKVGIISTSDGLLPHALIEFPNLLLYQGLSQYILFNFIMTKSIRLTFNVFKKFIPIYLLSFILLIIAALLEGYL